MSAKATAPIVVTAEHIKLAQRGSPELIAEHEAKVTADLRAKLNWLFERGPWLNGVPEMATPLPTLFTLHSERDLEAAMGRELSKQTSTAWVACSDRLPTQEDANDCNEVWWWIPRFSEHGPQLDYYDAPETATHWMACPNYNPEDPAPAPPIPQSVASNKKTKRESRP